MGARRPASGKAAAIILVEFVFPFFLYPSGRVAPICACVHWLHSLRLLPDGKSFLSIIIRQSTNALNLRLGALHRPNISPCTLNTPSKRTNLTRLTYIYPPHLVFLQLSDTFATAYTT